MNIFYTLINNNKCSHETLELAVEYVSKSKTGIIYVEESFEDIDRGPIRSLLYVNGRFIVEDVKNKYE